MSRSYANFSQIGSFYCIFSLLETLLSFPNTCTEVHWGEVVGKSELRSVTFSVSPLHMAPGLRS